MAIPGSGGPAGGRPTASSGPGASAASAGNGGTPAPTAAQPLTAKGGSRQLSRAQQLRRQARQSIGIKDVNQLKGNQDLLNRARSLGLLPGKNAITKPGVPNAGQVAKINALKAALARVSQSSSGPGPR